jgi:hypothetical protein
MDWYLIFCHVKGSGLTTPMCPNTVGVWSAKTLMKFPKETKETDHAFPQEFEADHS